MKWWKISRRLRLALPSRLYQLLPSTSSSSTSWRNHLFTKLRNFKARKWSFCVKSRAVLATQTRATPIQNGRLFHLLHCGQPGHPEDGSSSPSSSSCGHPGHPEPPHHHRYCNIVFKNASYRGSCNCSNESK